MKKGVLLVISGPSGSGKGTVVKELIKRTNIYLSVSATSRAKRVGEIEGESYYFLSREEFQRRAESGEFLEYTETYGNYYGTPKEPIIKAIESGKDILLEINSVGALNVKKNYPQAVLVFLTTPSVMELMSRLVSRGTESAAEIKVRSDCYTEELAQKDKYDFVVVNETVSRTADEILDILNASRLKNNNK